MATAVGLSFCLAEIAVVLENAEFLGEYLC